MLQRRRFTSLGLILLLGLTGCGDDSGSGGGGGGGNFVIGQNPEIRVEFNGIEIGQGDTVSVPATGSVNVESQPGSFYISNPDGNAPLSVSLVEISSNPPDLFRLESDDGGALPSADNPWTVADPATSGDQTRTLRLYFTRPADIQGVSGTLVVKSNTTNPTERTLTFEIRVDDQVPEINVNLSLIHI